VRVQGIAREISTEAAGKSPASFRLLVTCEAQRLDGRVWSWLFWTSFALRSRYEPRYHRVAKTTPLRHDRP